MISVNKIPVLLLTGYLGSGKTTLLNRILTNNKGIRFAVIVNDIGEVNIDASLIQKGGVVSQNDDSLVALQNGCICCSLKMDLVSQLHDLCAQKAFDYVVIEASGICEPAPIAQTLCSYAQMVPQFAQDGLPVLDCICSVVDALRLRDEFEGGEQLAHYVPKEEDLAALVIEQIEFSNIVLLNKASEVSEEELAHIKSIVRAIQPTAEIIETNYCDVDFDKILNTHMFDFDKTATSAAWIQEVEDATHHHHDDDDDDDEDEHEHHHHHDHDDDDDEDEHEHHHHHHDHDDDDDEHEHEHHHHHHHHHHGGSEGETFVDENGVVHHHGEHDADEVFTSWGIETPRKYTKEEIGAFLEELKNEEKYGFVIRSKGMVPSPDGEWIHFDYVPGEQEIRTGAADVTGKICVIGADLKDEELDHLFTR